MTENKEIKKVTDEVSDNIDEKQYEEALADFTKRLIVVELPVTAENDFSRYVKRVSGINCALAIINNETNTITLLQDEFEAPYDDFNLWIIAIKNSTEISSINEDVSKDAQNLYVVTSHSGRALVCCDEFWDKLCERLGKLRLIVSLYNREDKGTFIIASGIDNEEKMDMKQYLYVANKEDVSRQSYIYVRNVGMLSEAALNSEN